MKTAGPRPIRPCPPTSRVSLPGAPSGRTASPRLRPARLQPSAGRTPHIQQTGVPALGCMAPSPRSCAPPIPGGSARQAAVTRPSSTGGNPDGCSERPGAWPPAMRPGRIRVRSASCRRDRLGVNPSSARRDPLPSPPASCRASPAPTPTRSPARHTAQKRSVSFVPRGVALNHYCCRRNSRPSRSARSGHASSRPAPRTPSVGSRYIALPVCAFSLPMNS